MIDYFFSSAGFLSSPSFFSPSVAGFSPSAAAASASAAALQPLRQVAHFEEFMKDGDFFLSMSLPDLFEKALNVASGWDLENFGTYTGPFDRRTVATIGGWGNPENFKYDPSPSLGQGDEKLWSSLVNFYEEKLTATLQIPDAFEGEGGLTSEWGGEQEYSNILHTHSCEVYSAEDTLAKLTTTLRDVSASDVSPSYEASSEIIFAVSSNSFL